MSKFCATSVIDAALNYVKSNANSMSLQPSQPADRAAAVANTLASQAMVSGDFTLANGDTSGRKVTVAAKSGVLIGTSGTGTHVALISASELLLVTTCTSQAVTANGSNTVNFPAWKQEIQAPT